MWIDIKDAPWTPEQIEAVLAMGIERADWGWPDVILEDPIAYYQKSAADTAKLLTNVADDERFTTKELDDLEHPFQTPREAEL